MTEADACRIEQELSISLPSDYRELMLHYDIPWRINFSEDSLPEITDVGLFIKQERELRERGLMGVHRWPQHYLSIGSDGSGDLYFLDLSQGGKAVFCMSHDTGEINDVAPGIRSFVEERLRRESEWLERCEQRGSTPPELIPMMVHEVRPNKHRKWWQFWKPRYVRRRFLPPVR